MNDLSPETNQLLELARGAGGLSDERRAQLKAGLLTQIAAIGLVGAASAGAGATVVAGAGVAAGTGAGAASAGATAGKVAWFSSALIKAISALTLISAAGAGVYSVAHSRHPAAPAQLASTPAVTGQAVSAPSAAAPLAVPDIVAPSLELPVPPASPADGAHEKPAAVPARASNVAPSSAPVTAETLAEETRLLRDADQALRAGNAQRALALLDEHASHYPRGVLAPERNAERMIARCKLGQVDAKGAQAYLSAHASSAFAPRIRDACNVSAR